MIKKIFIPQLDVNDEYVTIVKWHVKDKAEVKKDEPLCLIETAKTVFELVAEDSGFIRIRKKEGEEAKIREVIGYLVSSVDIKIEEIVSNESQYSSPRVVVAVNNSQIHATNKAKELARSLNVDLGQLASKKGLIREKDVQAYHDARKVEETEIQLPLEPFDFEIEGQVNKHFLDLIIRDKTFVSLPSEEKVKLYRKNGAVIGKNVFIGERSLIISDYIDIEDDSSIGDNSYIKTEKLKIGRMVVIGSNVNIVTRRVKIGDVSYTGNNINIGGGGAFDKYAGIEIGSCCLISSESNINTCAKVTIGDEVGISPQVQIYTHNHWQNILDGYYPKFGPVTIGNKAYITGGALITPGVTIGEGSMVLANSLVVENVDDYSVVVGVPAKEIRKVNRNLSPERKDEIMKRLIVELKEILEYKGFNPDDVVYLKEYDASKLVKPVILSFNVLSQNAGLHSVIFDLTNYQVLGRQNAFSDEVRNFLRKRGVRFKPIYWRYTADKGLFTP